MRALTNSELQYVGAGAGDSKQTVKQKNGPVTLPTITVTPTSGEVMQAARGFLTNQCSFGAFARAADIGAAGGGAYAVRNGPAAVPEGAAGGAITGLARQDARCIQQIGNEIHFISIR